MGVNLEPCSHLIFRRALRLRQAALQKADRLELLLGHLAMSIAMTQSLLTSRRLKVTQQDRRDQSELRILQRRMKNDGRRDRPQTWMVHVMEQHLMRVNVHQGLFDLCRGPTM